MLTEQQLKERQLGIGGSDMPIIMGLSSYKTPYQLYLEKTGQVESSQEQTESQYWGSILESKIREEFSRRNNLIVETPDTFIHPEYHFLRGNLDGFIPSLNAVLEIKTANSFMKDEWGTEGSDNIPLPYLIQVAHYCAVSNADCAYIALLLGGNTYREFKYIRDFDLENTLIERAIEFWERVEKKMAPDATKQIDLKLMFPKHQEEKLIKADGSIKNKLHDLNDTRFKIKQLSELEEQYKFNIMQFMKDAECLTDEEGKPIVSWKANKKGTRTFLFKGIN